MLKAYLDEMIWSGLLDKILISIIKCAFINLDVGVVNKNSVSSRSKKFNKMKFGILDKIISACVPTPMDGMNSIEKSKMLLEWKNPYSCYVNHLLPL